MTRRMASLSEREIVVFAIRSFSVAAPRGAEPAGRSTSGAPNGSPDPLAGHGTLTQREAHVLGRDGVPLELAVSASDLEEAGTRFVVVDLNLAPLTGARYIMELKGTAAGKSEAAMLAFRVFR